MDTIPRRNAQRLGPIGLALLFSQVGMNFALAGGCDPIDKVDEHLSTNATPDGATCATYLSLAGDDGVSCHWEFAFRDDAALEHADALWTAIMQCRDGVVSGPDIQVNHPDSYDLRELRADKGTYRVSVKDKSGQNRTLVFLRLEQARAQSDN